MKIRNAGWIVGLVSVAFAMLIGCGGGGSTTGTTTGGPFSATFTVTPTAVNPGDPVTITWTSQNSHSSTPIFEDFEDDTVGGGVPLNGSFVAHPTVTETYSITFDPDGFSQHYVNYSQAVTVAPTAQKYIVVGDPNQEFGAVNILVTALQGISTQPVTLQTTIPSGGNFDALIIDETASISPSDVPTILAYLSQGKGIVLCGTAPNKLATGDRGNMDITSIQSWFGGGPTLKFASSSANPAIASNLVHVPLSIVYNYQSMGINGDGKGVHWTLDLYGLNQGAQACAGYNAPYLGTNDYWIASFGYKPAQGGRIFWEASPGLDPAHANDPVLFAAGARWAATGP